MVQSSDNFEKKIIIEESLPSSVYSELSKDDSSYLIDVRTKPEWNFVGYPYIKNMKNDIIFCEWAFYPLMQKNPHFEDEILSKLNLNNCRNLYFICRSGSRSFNAAFSFAVNFGLFFSPLLSDGVGDREEGVVFVMLLLDLRSSQFC